MTSAHTSQAAAEGHNPVVCAEMASIDRRAVADAWPRMPEHIRWVILALESSPPSSVIRDDQG